MSSISPGVSEALPIRKTREIGQLSAEIRSISVEGKL
jgi:hypothetical protein